MKEGGFSLLIMIVIGMILITFLFFLPTLLKPPIKEITPILTCDAVYSSCLEKCLEIPADLKCETDCKTDYDACKKSSLEIDPVIIPKDDGDDKTIEEEEETDEEPPVKKEKEKVIYENELLDILYNYAIPFALLISYSIVALAFMASKVFSSREAESWAKLELREVLISTIYAATIISMVPVFDSILSSFSETYTGFPVDEMFINLLDTSFTPVRETVNYLFVFSSFNWIGWNPSGRVGIPFMPVPKNFVDLQFTHFYDGKSYINFFSLFAHTFIPILFASMISIMGQIILLNFFEKVLFIFVGLGLALRSFTFTRKMGATLLAVVLGIYFLFKLLLIVESGIYVNMNLNNPVSFPKPDLLFLDELFGGITLLMGGLVKLFEVIGFAYPIQLFIDCFKSLGPFGGFCPLIVPIIHVIDIILAVIQVIGGLISWAISVLIINVMGVVTLTTAVDYVIVNSIALYSDVITFAFFMPILNFIIIIAGIKSLAETFGGDVSVVNMLTFI